MDNERLKHMEFIQGVVDRMARSSFQMKGWAVTLVSALFVLSASGLTPWVALVAFLPIICFWALDAYYLRQERLFRKLYEVAASESEDLPPFSMDTRPWSVEVASVPGIMFTRTQWPLYLGLGVVTGAVWALLRFL